MTITSESIAIFDHDAGNANAKPLMDALQDVAGSRSMRDLFRSVRDGEVRCALRLPLVADERSVEPATLGRALRKVVRTAVDAASAGDELVVDFRREPDSRLLIAAGPVAEMDEHWTAKGSQEAD